MGWVVAIERTESFTIDIEFGEASSEKEAIEKAKQMIINDEDDGGRWSDSMEFTHHEAWED